MLRNRSLAGSAMTSVALPWLVLATTGSTARMGWVLAAEMAPIAVFGIPAGTLIGKLGGTRTMLLCDAACAINFVAQGIVLGVQSLAYFRFDANAHVLGLLFGGFGVGALLGAVVAQRVTKQVPLLKLAAVAIVAMPLPLFLLAPATPWPAALVGVGAFAFFTPLVNAPIIGVLTVRTPQELRPKVMTAVMTVATMAGPFGFIVAGYVLRHVALGPFFVALPALLTLGGLAFAALLLRQSGTAAGDVAVPNVAHG